MQDNLFFFIQLQGGEQRLAFYVKVWYYMGEKEGKVFLERGNWYEKENIDIIIFIIKRIWF